MSATDPPSVPASTDLPPEAHRRMAAVLRVGLAVAVVLLAVGTAAIAIRSGSSGSAAWIASNPLVRYLDLRALGGAILAGTPQAYLTLGVYALVATPVVRVLTGIGVFAAHRERRMAALAAVVLALLLFGLLVVGPLVR
jgi:uncharacterized membrane protein